MRSHRFDLSFLFQRQEGEKERGVERRGEEIASIRVSEIFGVRRSSTAIPSIGLYLFLFFLARGNLQVGRKKYETLGIGMTKDERTFQRKVGVRRW